MSQYCEYDKTSSTYDTARQPIDVEDLLSRIEALAAARGCPVSDLKLLDVGAGSGNYYQSLRERGCMIQYCGLEGSQGMMDKFMAKAMAKDEVLRGAFSLQQCDLTKLPLDLESESFDVIMITQVLHHLSNGRDEHKPIFDLMTELGRITRPHGGFLWCQTQTQEQHEKDGFWWSVITPKASAKLAARFPPLSNFFESLKDGGMYTSVQAHVPEATLMKSELYLDLEGAFKEEWRNCDSNWAICDDEELQSGLARLRQIIDSGGTERFLEEREAVRKGTGQTTTVVATKD